MERADILRITVDGAPIRCKGEFTVRPGVPKRNGIIGTNEVAGFNEEIVIPFVEGALTDSANLNLEDFFMIKNATVNVEFANGKTFLLTEAYYAGSAEIKSKENEVNVRFEGKEGKYI